MLQKVAAYIEKNNLLTHGKTVIVALSGGADSVTLLDVLQKLDYQCIAAHCNFHLRGDESVRDEIFVQNLCKAKNIPLFVQHFETEKFAKENKISIEMAARQLRYRWFEELLLENNAQAIAVAHHQDDNIETFFLNIFRGTGLKGLGGIRAKNKNIVRPLLNVNRADIENYIKVNNLNYITDSSNFDNKYKRNKIRNEILPLLQTLNPSIENTTLDEINVFKGIYNIYENVIENIKNEILISENNIVKIHINNLLEQNEKETILFEIIKDYGFNFSQAQQIVETLNAVSGKLFYSKTHQLVKDRKFLIIKENKLNFNNKECQINLDCSEIFNPIHLKIKKYSKTNEFIIKKDKHTIQIDYNKITFPLKLRRWNKGDEFYPFGMKKRQKLSDFFINNKLNIFEKNDTFVLTSEENIAWIVGLRADNRYKIDENTHEILEITLI